MQLPPLIEGRFVRRYKRFFADVELESGELVVAHCPNPGSMKTCAPERARVWLSRSDDPRRKLAYSWELVRANGQMVVVNTARGNQVVAHGLARGAVPELAGFDELRREVAYGERSRVDFVLRYGDTKAYVEVKSVTMSAGEGVSSFPDSVTERGRRHLEELMRMRQGGHRAVLLFCVARSRTRRVRPADEIDPAYGATLRRAVAAGVEVLAYGCEVGTRRVRLARRLPLDL